MSHQSRTPKPRAFTGPDGATYILNVCRIVPEERRGHEELEELRDEQMLNSAEAWARGEIERKYENGEWEKPPLVERRTLKRQIEKEQ